MEDFFANLKKTVSGTVDVVSKKTEEMIEVQKLRNKLHAAENKRRQDYKTIGEMIAKRYNSGEAFDETIAEICDEINKLQREEEELKKEVSKKTGKVLCPSCDHANPRTAVYCMHCGNELKTADDVVTEDDFEDEDLENLPPYEEELEEYPEENSESL